MTTRLVHLGAVLLMMLGLQVAFGQGEELPPYVQSICREHLLDKADADYNLHVSIEKKKLASSYRDYRNLIWNYEFPCAHVPDSELKLIR